MFHAASEIHVDLPGLRGRAGGGGSEQGAGEIRGLVGSLKGPHGLRVQMSFSRGFEVWHWNMSRARIIVLGTCSLGSRLAACL